MTDQNSCAIVLTEVEAFGGAERSCLALSHWLYKNGIANHLVAYSDAANLPRYASHPLRIVQLKPQRGAYNKISALRRYFHDHPGRPKPLMSGYQPALHGYLAGAKGYHTLMHDTPSLFSDGGTDGRLSSNLRRKFLDSLVARGLRGGGKCIVTSEYLRRDSRAYFGVDADIVRMGGMAHAGSFRLRPVTAELRMLSVSRVEANKRIDWMLHALATLEQAVPKLSSQINWHLDVAGKGSLMEPLRQMASELGLADRVHLHGFVSDEQLEELYAAAHLFLMPAVQGYGIPATESIYRGAPVLLHRLSGVSDILLDTPWATVIEGDEESMAPGLAKAIESVRAGSHHAFPIPPIPTEDEWAQKVATLCGWV